VLVERREVLVAVTAREDRCVDERMQGLDAAAEQLRDAGQLVDVLDVEADVALEKLGCAAARDELEAELGQPARELLQAGLVVDRDQCTALQSSLTTSGSRRCSTAWMRSTSVSRGSTGTDSWRMTAPVSRPSST
jgi:hypothetical protein